MRSAGKLVCLALCTTLVSSTALARGPVGSWAMVVADDPITPDSANAARFSVEQQGQRLSGAGAHDQAAQLYWQKGVELKDPVLIIAGAEAWRDHARAQRTVASAQTALDQVAVALDMLYFLRDGATSSRWQPVAPEYVGSLIQRANAVVSDANALIATIQAEQANASAPPPVEEKRAAKPGTGLIAGGSAMLVLGIGGAGLGIAGLALGAKAQAQVEDPTVYEPEHSQAESRGRTANVLAGVGLAVAGVAVITGAVLVAIGVKKRRLASVGFDAQLAPVVGPRHAGLGLVGRF